MLGFLFREVRFLSMKSKFIRIAVLLLLAGLFASPLLAQCEEQEVKIQLLTRQIAAMNGSVRCV